ncbi:MAG: hypothetical protein ACP5M7_07905 [Thermoproteota archaeon]
MANVTLAVPDETYKKMKKYKEIKWSEVIRRAVVEYIRRIEEGGFSITSKGASRGTWKGLQKELK